MFQFEIHLNVFILQHLNSHTYCIIHSFICYSEGKKGCVLNKGLKIKVTTTHTRSDVETNADAAYGDVKMTVIT